MSSQSTAIFGDFQTPAVLASQVAALTASTNGEYAAVVEPTCGTGSFLIAAAQHLGKSVSYHGYDINPDHVRECLDKTRKAGVDAQVERRDFYDLDWKSVFDALPEGVLVIGNPPWITNAALESLGGANLPVKSNFQGHAGFAAKTGEANFDISEWMLIRLLEGMQRKRATLAMLCKTATARKVLRHAWRHGLELNRSSIHLIDAARYFGVSVDACLLLTHIGESDAIKRAIIYQGLSFTTPVQTFGIVNGEMVSDVVAYQNLADLDGIEYRKWRSGVKHDAARVMELEATSNGYLNGLGEHLELESDYVFPLLKSSNLANGHLTPQRFVLVTQTQISDDTALIQLTAPKTWNYLMDHADVLDSRGSSIYAKRARFAVFGVGPYTFSPWKVAISALHKKLQFQVIGNVSGKPILVDDTCYFFPCESEEEAEFFAHMLNSDVALRFLHSLVFFDSKRAVTIDALKRIDLKKLAERFGKQDRAARHLSRAPYEAGAQQLLIFERRAKYRTKG